MSGMVYKNGYNDKEHNERMKNLFPDVKRIFLKYCPVCGASIYKVNGYIDPENRTGYVDYVTECDCDYEAIKEEQRKKTMSNYEREHVETLLKTSGMNEIDRKMISISFQGHNIDKYNSLMNFARSFDNSKSTNILLTGTTGTGKTMVACHMINEIINNGYEAKKIQANEYYNLVKESYSYNEVGRQLKTYEICDFLVLDDLGTEPVTDDAKINITTLIDKRYCNQKPILITTNLNHNELFERYGQRIISRLSTFKKISFLGNDNRTNR